VPWIIFFSLSLWRTLIAKIFSVSVALWKRHSEANEGGSPLGLARWSLISTLSLTGREKAGAA
jgi:hypothetical protein